MTTQRSAASLHAEAAILRLRATALEEAADLHARAATLEAATPTPEGVTLEEAARLRDRANALIDAIGRTERTPPTAEDQAARIRRLKRREHREAAGAIDPEMQALADYCDGVPPTTPEPTTTHAEPPDDVTERLHAALQADCPEMPRRRLKRWVPFAAGALVAFVAVTAFLQLGPMARLKDPLNDPFASGAMRMVGAARLTAALRAEGEVLGRLHASGGSFFDVASVSVRGRLVTVTSKPVNARSCRLMLRDFEKLRGTGSTEVIDLRFGGTRADPAAPPVAEEACPPEVETVVAATILAPPAK